MTRFQPLPIRTAREVFPSISSPHKLHQKGYETYQMADTFINIFLSFREDELSSPNRALIHHRDIHYSISAIQYYAFDAASFSSITNAAKSLQSIPCLFKQEKFRLILHITKDYQTKYRKPYPK